MIRKSFATKALILIVAFIAFYAMFNLFLNDKSWGAYALAVAGFASLPILSTLFVRTLNVLPSSKVVIIATIWSAWVALGGVAALATYYYVNNNSYGGCGGGMINSSDVSGGLCLGG